MPKTWIIQIFLLFTMSMETVTKNVLPRLLNLFNYIKHLCNEVLNLLDIVVARGVT